jgi:hypothetical protein
LLPTGNIAPVIIGGMVSAEGVGGSGLWADTPLQDSMTGVICGAYLVSAGFFGLASAAFRRADNPMTASDSKHGKL